MPPPPDKNRFCCLNGLARFCDETERTHVFSWNGPEGTWDKMSPAPFFKPHPVLSYRLSWGILQGHLGAVATFLLLATMLRPADALAEGELARAATYLKQDLGLHAVSGNVWISPSERAVRENLRGLDDARRDVVQRQQALDERRRANYDAWEASRRQIARLKSLLSAPDTDESGKQKIKRQIAEWESRAVDPKKLAAVPDVRSLLIQLSNARNRLALDLLSLRRLIPQIAPEYQQLAASDRVQTALRTLGPSHRLGPLSENYNKDLRRLPDYERIVFTPWAPVYLQSGHIRVDLIINERTPVTFTWLDSNDPLVLTDAISETVGIHRVKEDERTIPIQLGQGRRLLAHRTTVAAIRLGQHVLHDVTCLVIPPEAEDLGAQIGIDAWSDFDAKIELDRFRLIMQPRR